MFLWKPLTSPSSYYAPADVLQGKAIFRIPPPDYRIQNPLQQDPADLFDPWLKWDKSSLSRSELPTWNPYNGSGVPQLANYESAVFSPFSLPIYALPFRVGLLAAAALKLLVAGFFSYLFLRRVRFAHLAALTGAVIFMFSAYNVLWLNWTAAASAACLPLALYCAELVVQARDARRLRIALAALSLAVAVSLLVGYAETTFFSLVVTVSWLAARLAIRGFDWRRMVAAAGATLLGFLLAAVQLLPFVQYLAQSSSYALRAAHPPPTQDPRFLGLLALPNIFGNPSQQYHDAAIPIASFTNFNEVATVYVGLLTLFLALIGLTSVRGSHSYVARFFGIVAVVWFAYAYNIAGIEHLLRLLPGLRTAYPGRSDPVWAFSAGALAAAGIDRSIKWSRSRRSSRSNLALIGGLLVIAGGVLGWTFYQRSWLLHTFANVPGSSLQSDLARNAIGRHVLYMSLTFAVGVGAVVLLTLAGRRRAIRIGCGLVLVAAVFAQTGFLFKNYNPTVDRRYVYPVTPTLASFSAHTGDTQTLWLDDTAIVPDGNLWYQLNSAVSYDAIGVKNYDDLYSRLLRAPQSSTEFFGPPQGPRNLTGLQALGIRYVSTGTDYPFGTEATPSELSDTTGASSTSLGQGQASTTQEFVANTAGLNLLLVGTNGGGPSCRATLELEELPSSRQVARADAPCNSPETSFVIPPLGDSAGKQYRAVITGSGGASVLRSAGPTGHLVMAAYATDVPGLEPVETVGTLHLFAVPGTPAQYYSPAQARPVADDSDAFALLQRGGVDVGQTVLINRPVSSSDGSPGSVRVVKRSPTEIRLDVTRAQPGWLVALQTYYPGWSATVNGHRVSVTRADVAFSAVPVGPGTSQVVLRYRPSSVRIGLIVSALALVVLLALVGSAIRWRRPTRWRRRTRPAGGTARAG